MKPSDDSRGSKSNEVAAEGTSDPAGDAFGVGQCAPPAPPPLTIHQRIYLVALAAGCRMDGSGVRDMIFQCEYGIDGLSVAEARAFWFMEPDGQVLQ